MRDASTDSNLSASLVFNACCTTGKPWSYGLLEDSFLEPSTCEVEWAC